MRKYFAVALVAAMLAVGLSMAVIHTEAAFQTISSGPVWNAGQAQFFRDVRGYKMVYAVAGTATNGKVTTVTGMEAGDVILDVIDLGANASTISASNLANINEAIYTAAAGGAVLDTSVGAGPTVDNNLIFLFADIDNTN